MSCLSLYAGENLVFHLKSGGQTIIALDERPVITFEEDNMVLTSETTHFSIPLSDIANYNFVEGTDVEQVQDKVTKPIIANGHVYFSKLKVGSRVFVYAIDGRQLRSYYADGSGSVDVDLTTLSKGIFVLKSPEASIKITNR